MDVNQAFYHTVHRHPGGCESLAPMLGMTSAVLRNKANLHQQSNKASLADADAAMAITGNYLVLHTLARNHGFVCYRLECNHSPSDLAILELVAAVWGAHGEVGAAVMETLADGRVERHELERVKQAVYATTQRMQEMLGRLERIVE